MRERKIKWLEESGLCSVCYAAQQAKMLADDGYEIKEMHYGEYKRYYPDNRNVPGSYNAATQKVQVYVKAEQVEVAEKSKKIIKDVSVVCKDAIKNAEAYGEGINIKIVPFSNAILDALSIARPDEIVDAFSMCDFSLNGKDAFMAVGKAAYGKKSRIRVYISRYLAENN